MQIPSLGRVDGGFSVGENDGGVRSCLIVIAYELLQLGCLVRSEVVGPAVADRLIEEFDGDMEGAGGPIGGGRSAWCRSGGEVGIGRGFALDGDVGWCGGLVKAAGRMRLSLRYCVAERRPVVTWPWLSPRMGSKIWT
jgi:hypothetical protein